MTAPFDSITLRFCRDTFLDGTEATIGASFLTKMLTISERQIKFEMWYVKQIYVNTSAAKLLAGILLDRNDIKILPMLILRRQKGSC